MWTQNHFTTSLNITKYDLLQYTVTRQKAPPHAVLRDTRFIAAVVWCAVVPLSDRV